METRTDADCMPTQVAQAKVVDTTKIETGPLLASRFSTKQSWAKMAINEERTDKCNQQ